jgi:hypothetical protein
LKNRPKRRGENGQKTIMPDQHVVPHPDGWAVKGEKNERASSVHRTQEQAIHDAQRIAKNQRGEVVIHGRNGKIRDSDSYGGDPCPPRDRKH